ncbi:hypothetical protein [Streptomyces sp. NPDC003480]
MGWPVLDREESVGAVSVQVAGVVGDGVQGVGGDGRPGDVGDQVQGSGEVRGLVRLVARLALDEQDAGVDLVDAQQVQWQAVAVAGTADPLAVGGELEQGRVTGDAGQGISCVVLDEGADGCIERTPHNRAQASRPSSIGSGCMTRGGALGSDTDRTASRSEGSVSGAHNPSRPTLS